MIIVVLPMSDKMYFSTAQASCTCVFLGKYILKSQSNSEGGSGDNLPDFGKQIYESNHNQRQQLILSADLHPYFVL